ncbi:protein FAM98C isoform X2 [Paroedura picta]|uniref:protein FAM98C isoform X2 n=1 Tax=Paroedura picta TaxID=143630 RepID=UPI00405744F8
MKESHDRWTQLRACVVKRKRQVDAGRQAWKAPEWKELRALCPLEEDVSPACGAEDAETFQIEMSGLLGELHCPYPSLTKGDVTTRLCTPENCLQLLYFLSSELLAARLQARKRPPLPERGKQSLDAIDELQRICQALGMPEANPGCPVPQLMADLKVKISGLLSSLSLEQMAPLLKMPLTLEEWNALEKIHGVLRAQYQSRKCMMITRFDVTIESFYWSERAKERGEAMSEAFQPLRQSLRRDSQVTLAHLLAARGNLSCIVKTSSGMSRDKTSCAINKVLMTGSVPDRGGRPNEIERPMPLWEKRREGGGGDGGHQRWGKRGKKKKK